MPSIAPLRRLLPYFVPYRNMVGLGLVLVVGAAAAAAIVPWLLSTAIDSLLDGVSTSAVLRTASLLVAAAVVGGALRYGMRELMNGVSRRIEYDLRNDLFGHLTTLDAAYFGRNRTGDIMARLTNDLNAVRMSAGPAIMYLVNTLAGGLFALTFMTRIDVRLTALALLPLTVLPFLMVRLGREIHVRFDAVQEHFSTLTTHVQENLSGVRVVRAYLQEGAELARFDALNDEYLRRNLYLVKLYGGMNPAFGLLAGLGAVVVLGFGGQLVLQGTITVGAFVAFGFYLAMLTWPLISLGWVINLFQRGAASLSRLEQILQAQPAVTAPVHPRHLPEARGARTLEFRNVGFHYPTVDDQLPRWVLRNVSFTVPAGATVGLVGATGSGKSALLDLVPRLFDPQEGQILLDGVDIRDLPLAELRQEVATVPQESLLFSETIGENLSYGLPVPAADGSLPDGSSPADAAEAVAWATDIAQLSSTIDELPDGLETMLGERGVNLSGGQRQRAALARALARRSRVLVLDDTLSAVDTHTEAAILAGLRNALAERTALLASHRISAIRDAAFVVVLEEGQVVELGSHEQLIAARGRYWSLLRRQQLEEAIAGDAPPDEPGSAELATGEESPPEEPEDLLAAASRDMLARAEPTDTFEG